MCSLWVSKYTIRFFDLSKIYHNMEVVQLRVMNFVQGLIRIHVCQISFEFTEFRQKNYENYQRSQLNTMFFSHFISHITHLFSSTYVIRFYSHIFIQAKCYNDEQNSISHRYDWKASWKMREFFLQDEKLSVSSYS